MDFSWSRESVQALIELYEQHGNLYNIRSKTYKNSDLNSAALIMIAKEMNKNVLQ